MILPVLACLNYSPMVPIRRGKYNNTKTSTSFTTHGRLYILTCASNNWRTTSEEKRYEEKMALEDPEITYQHIRRAAEVHRQVRQYARRFIKPGMTMTEIANGIEDGVRSLVEEDGLESGIGFPTGLSLNECAAHYTPNAGDTVGKTSCSVHNVGKLNVFCCKVLQKEDVLKVDIGVQVKGRICDSAFTLNFQPTYDKLLEAVKDATNTGIRVRYSQ